MSRDEAAKVRELLTGHVNKTLSADDQAFMDQWMNDPDRAHPELADEAQWLAITREQLRGLPPRVDPDAGWHELSARIEAEMPAVPHGPHADPAQGFVAAWFWRWWHRPALAYAVLVLLVGQSALLAWHWVPSGGARLMSAPTAAQAPVASELIDVAWQAQASAAQMQAALLGVGGSVVSGPSALGLWRVAVPPGQVDHALTALRAHPAVAQAVRAP